MFENSEINTDLLPSITKIEFKKIHKNYLKVILINFSLFFCTLFIATYIVIYLKFNAWFPNHTYLLYVILSLLGIVALTHTYIGFSRRKYALREKDISYKSGVLIHKLTTVPFSRIQHIEIEEGFFSRLFNLAAINIFTAGESAEDLTIRGILKTDAYKIKTFINNNINE